MDAEHADTCPVCQEPISCARQLAGCAHKFCYHCIYMWTYAGNSSCPVCRHSITTINDPELTDQIESLKRTLADLREKLHGMKTTCECLVQICTAAGLLPRAPVSPQPRRSERIRDQRARRGQDRPYNPPRASTK